jgi:hypothetical protein
MENCTNRESLSLGLGASPPKKALNFSHKFTVCGAHIGTRALAGKAIKQGSIGLP